KYHGRIVADAATAQTPDVSAAMLASGHARAYHGGHRGSWCNRAFSG
ncbi:MAG TPA: nuclease, partial [Nitrobacter sp.]|nr:nuclease [Nitrobacter sp.]